MGKNLKKRSKRSNRRISRKRTRKGTRKRTRKGTRKRTRKRSYKGGMEEGNVYFKELGKKRWGGRKKKSSRKPPLDTGAIGDCIACAAGQFSIDDVALAQQHRGRYNQGRPGPEPEPEPEPEPDLELELEHERDQERRGLPAMRWARTARALGRYECEDKALVCAAERAIIARRRDRAIEVVCPEGVKAGNVITVLLDNGDELEAEVPEGCSPGDFFDVSIDYDHD